MNKELRIAVAAIIFAGLAIGALWGIITLTEKLTSPKTAEVAAAPSSQLATQPATETQPADKVATTTTQPAKEAIGSKWNLFGPIALAAASVVVALIVWWAFRAKKKGAEGRPAVTGAASKAKFDLSQWWTANWSRLLVLIGLAAAVVIFHLLWDLERLVELPTSTKVIFGGVLMILVLWRAAAPSALTWRRGTAVVIGATIGSFALVSWWNSGPAGSGYPTTRPAAAPAPKQDWQIVVFFPRGNEKAVNPASLTENTPETKVFVFYHLRGGGKNDYGTVKIHKATDDCWQGEYRQPGGWGKLLLTSNKEETHFTGKWSSPDSPNLEWQKGGDFQIIKQ